MLIDTEAVNGPDRRPFASAFPGLPLVAPRPFTT